MSHDTIPADFPKFAFHPTEAPRQVATPAALKQLGPEWSTDLATYQAYVSGQMGEPVTRPGVRRHGRK